VTRDSTRLIPIANLTRLDNDPRGVLLQIDGVSYKFKPGTTHSTQRRFVGYIAQQIESVVPSAVQLIDGILHVDYESLIPYLSESIKQNFNDIKNNKHETQKIHEMVDQLFADFTELKEKHTNSVSDSRTHAPLPYRMRWYKLLIGISVAALLIVSIAIGALVLYEEHKDDNINHSQSSPLHQVWTVRQALEEFYDAMSGACWLNNTGWMKNDDFCSWYGITCENGTVTKIDLRGNSLLGMIPRNFSLVLKDSLRHLDLSSNFIYGTIPEDILSLDSATLINLSENGLTGNIPVPFSRSWIQLRYLNLATNKIIGTISGTLIKLPSLRYLNLSSNSLEGSLPDAAVMNLQELDLSWNTLSGSIPVTSSLEIASINLSYNRLSGEVRPMSFWRVQKLNLRSNMLIGAFELALIDHFTDLDISHNFFDSFKLMQSQLNVTEIQRCDASQNPFKCPLPTWLTERCHAHCMAV
jgi:hypothetical protein